MITQDINVGIIRYERQSHWVTQFFLLLGGFLEGTLQQSKYNQGEQLQNRILQQAQLELGIGCSHLQYWEFSLKS